MISKTLFQKRLFQERLFQTLWRKVSQLVTQLRLIKLMGAGAVRLLRGLLNLFLIVCLSVGLVFQAMPSADAQTSAAALNLRKQATDRSRPQAMTPSEIARLNDPLFNLVIKEHSDLKTLAAITQQLQPEGKSTFVVHEQIVDDRQRPNGNIANRRSVLTFTGNTAGEALENNIMFSVFFDANRFPSSPSIEAMAWDDSAGKFNYYKLDRARGESDVSWKFRNDSKAADVLSLPAREGTCLACHINGGMVMKEFNPPWNNWHSLDFDVAYLRAESIEHWPVAEAASSPLQNLQGARFLEATMMSANARLIERRMATLSGNNQVEDVKRLLKPLFVTTEFNLMSSTASSKSHPFSKDRGSNGSTVTIPQSFFLDAARSQNLGIDSFAMQDFVSLSDRAYQEVVNRGRTSLAGETPGDTHFAWFTPEASIIDNDYVSRLTERGLVPRAFVAAVMSVDLENPVFSGDREQLWTANNILPARFNTGRNNTLMAQTVQNLERLNPAGDSPEGQFLAALKDPDPVKLLQRKVNRYIAQERVLFEDASTKPEEVARLYRKLLVTREKISNDPVQKHLNESPLLFPKGDIAALPKTVNVAVVKTRPILRRGATGDDVVSFQKLLKALDFLSGPADGAFGPGTERAAIAAQRSLKLDADGIIGPQTWKALERVAALPVLKQGDIGNDVVKLQTLLQRSGFLNGSADGEFGPMTERSVVAAQRQFGLRASGVVSPGTWARLAA